MCLPSREAERLALGLACIVRTQGERDQTLKLKHRMERIVEAAVERLHLRHAALAACTPSASSMRDASSGRGRAKR